MRGSTSTFISKDFEMHGIKPGGQEILVHVRNCATGRLGIASIIDNDISLALKRLSEDITSISNICWQCDKQCNSKICQECKQFAYRLHWYRAAKWSTYGTWALIVKFAINLLKTDWIIPIIVTIALVVGLAGICQPAKYSFVFLADLFRVNLEFGPNIRN